MLSYSREYNAGDGCPVWVVRSGGAFLNSFYSEHDAQRYIKQAQVRGEGYNPGALPFTGHFVNWQRDSVTVYADRIGEAVPAILAKFMEYQFQPASITESDRVSFDVFDGYGNEDTFLIEMN